jgi:transposase
LDTLFIGYSADNKEKDMQRKSYTREFKIRAVQLMEESSKPIRRVAEELGVSENNLYNWRKQLRERADKAFSNQPRLDENELEIRRLKARVSELEEEREILKKAAVFFAKEENQRSTR